MAEAPSPQAEDSTAIDDGSQAASPLAIGTLIIALAATCAIFWTSLVEMWDVWNIDPNYSHGFVVPIVSGLMGYFACRRLGFRIAERLDATSLIVGVVSLLLGGQIAGRSLRLFQIYSAGNFVEATEDFACRIACEVKGFDPLDYLAK